MNFFFSTCCYMWLQSLQSSSFSKPFFLDSSFVSFQLSIFFSSLLFTTLQHFFPLLSLLFITTGSPSSGLTTTNFNWDSFFIGASTLAAFFCHFFFLSLHCYYACFLAIPFNLIIAIPKTVFEHWIPCHLHFKHSNILYCVYNVYNTSFTSRLFFTLYTHIEMWNLFIIRRKFPVLCNSSILRGTFNFGC